MGRQHVVEYGNDDDKLQVYISSALRKCMAAIEREERRTKGASRRSLQIALSRCAQLTHRTKGEWDSAIRHPYVNVLTKNRSLLRQNTRTKAALLRKSY